MLLSSDSFISCLLCNKWKNGFCSISVEGTLLDFLCLEIEKVNLQVHGGKDLSTCSNNWNSAFLCIQQKQLLVFWWTSFSCFLRMCPKGQSDACNSAVYKHVWQCSQMLLPTDSQKCLDENEKQSPLCAFLVRLPRIFLKLETWKQPAFWLRDTFAY